MIARLPRLDGVEHDADCSDQARPLRFKGSSSSWDGDVEQITVRLSCASCGLDVELTAHRDT